MRFAKSLVATALIFMCALFLVSIVSPQRIDAQQRISVRFFDYKTGKPIKKIYVDARFWNGKNPQDVNLAKNVVSSVILKTDKNGEIVIPVSEPVAQHLYISSPDFLWNGSLMISPTEVIKSGIVLPYQGEICASKVQISAKPGEIIIFNKKLTAWDRMRQEIPR